VRPSARVFASQFLTIDRLQYVRTALGHDVLEIVGMPPTGAAPFEIGRRVDAVHSPAGFLEVLTQHSQSPTGLLQPCTSLTSLASPLVVHPSARSSDSGIFPDILADDMPAIASVDERQETRNSLEILPRTQQAAEIVHSEDTQGEETEFVELRRPTTDSLIRLELPNTIYIPHFDGRNANFLLEFCTLA